MNILVNRVDYHYDLPALKLHLGIAHNELDSLIADQVQTAVGIIESELGIALREITWKCITDELLIKLPYCPFSITSIKYWKTTELTAVANTDYKLLTNGEILWHLPISYDSRTDA